MALRQPRFLFYAVNGLGLGHVTRCLALARGVRELVPDAEILFLTSSEASHLIYREGFAALKIPSRTAASHTGLRRDSFVRLTQSVVWNTLLAFDPHCLICDTFPAGTLHELLPVLRWPLKKIFVFRAQRPEKSTDSFLQNSLRLFDLILIPHNRGAEVVPVPETVPSLWTGPMLIRAAEQVLLREAARAALGMPADGLLGLISLGGGGDIRTVEARARLRQMLDARPDSGTVRWLEMPGPLARSGEPPRPNELGDLYPLLPYLPAFDCAIAAAGYNTTHELQAVRVPTLLWPFERDVDDQRARAESLEREGKALCVSSVDELESSVTSLMDAATRRHLVSNMKDEFPRGAAIGAGAIADLVAG